MPGKIEKKVLALLAAEPDNAFTVEDLCEEVYGAAEKKHRVAMLRVVNRLAAEDGTPDAATSRLRWHRADRRGGEVVLYDALNVSSYATARIKADTLSKYRAKGWGMSRWSRYRPYVHVSRAEAEEQVKERLADGRYQELIAEGGAWW